MSKLACALCFFFVACSAPKPTTPSLTPEAANQLLHYNNKAEDWLTYIRKHDPSCTYRLDLPDQTAHPSELDLDHIVRCGGNRPSPKEYDASVIFQYDPATQKWIITRFSD
jgi:hypothetical protein